MSDAARIGENMPPDVDCYTLPNGECIATPCRLHDPTPSDDSRTVPLPDPLCIEGGCERHNSGGSRCAWDECDRGVWNVTEASLTGRTEGES